MEAESKRIEAENLMERFAQNTGLTGKESGQRYLWTDAFAVCNFLELHKRTGREKYLQLALNLVDQVHLLLGRHRADDSRTGWISDLGEKEGDVHPTAGGLRIGKNLPERRRNERYDQRLEWDRDGQYFHYLTKWMQALHHVFLQTRIPEYQQWAFELARAAHAGFTVTNPDGSRQLFWKMSIDLSFPLVPAMGHHDPLDGYLTYLELESSIPRVLESEITEMAELCNNRDWTSDDPLALGGTLHDALRACRLMAKGGKVFPGLLGDLLASAVKGLDHYLRREPLAEFTEYRLAFRELGLAIGLSAPVKIKKHIENKPEIFSSSAYVGLLDKLLAQQKIREQIELYWLEAKNQRAESWRAHRDINMVMLATALLPDTFLGE